jgi:hypothetical protein
LVAGLLLVGATTIGFMLAKGSTLPGLLDGILLQHRRFATTYYLPFTDHGFGLAALILAASGIVAFLAVRNILWRTKESWLLSFGQAVFSGFVLYWANSQDFVKLISLALPFAWLGALPQRASSPANQFARLTLVAAWWHTPSQVRNAPWPQFYSSW